MKYKEYFLLAVFVFFGIFLSVLVNSTSKKGPVSTQNVLSETETFEEDLKSMCEAEGCNWSSNTCDCSNLNNDSTEDSTSSETESASETTEPQATQEPAETTAPAATEEPQYNDADYDKALRCAEYSCTWTNNSCFCDETTNTSSFDDTNERTSDSSETDEHDIDRLSSADSVTINCIRERLTSQELDIIRFLEPTNSNERELLNRLKDKAQICFETYSETKNIEQASREILKIEDEKQRCFIDKVGLENFKQINAGLREPTAIEKTRAQECFGFAQEEHKISFNSIDEPLDEEVLSCLAVAIGQDRLDSAAIGDAGISLEQREKVKRCFGQDPHPLAGPAEFELSTAISSCLVDAVGKTRFEEISSGKFEPTEEEMIAGESCFGNINEVQQNLLPPPPEQIPFLKETDEVQVGSVDQLINRTEDGVVDQTIILKGTGPADSIVDIVIFSDPIVVTTTTDENGEWVYELKDPIEGTNHIVYATVRGASGERVRSAVFNFDVVAASELEAAAPLLSESQTASSANDFIRNAAILVLGIFALASIFIGFINVKKLFRQTKSLDGESNSEDTPGSMN